MSGPGDAGLEQGRIVSTQMSNGIQSWATNADHCKATKSYRYIAYGWGSISCKRHESLLAVLLRRSAAEHVWVDDTVPGQLGCQPTATYSPTINNETENLASWSIKHQKMVQ